MPGPVIAARKITAGRRAGQPRCAREKRLRRAFHVALGLCRRGRFALLLGKEGAAGRMVSRALATSL